MQGEAQRGFQSKLCKIRYLCLWENSSDSCLKGIVWRRERLEAGDPVHGFP